ncbi:MAG: hypothetical protein CTY32_08430 [Methylotenera sp.]|nr:MAG: hypothetical protein CTY32_08430 [Methylotenera sp.]
MTMANVIQFSDMKKVSPQKEDGYTPIANELFEQIISFNFSKRHLSVILAVARMTYGYSRKADALSGWQIAEMTKIDRSDVSKTLSELVRMNVITKHEDGRNSHGIFVNNLSINKDYSTWLTVGELPTVGKTPPLVNYPRTVGELPTVTVGELPSVPLVKHPTHKAIKTNKTKPKNKYVHFDIFWCAYPKKLSKKKALESFEKLNPDSELLQTMLDAIEKSKSSESWLEQNGKFIPMAATWLNGERWNDEVEITTEYSSMQVEVFNAYNSCMPNAGWPDALHDTYLAERSSAINTFLNLPDMTIERLQRYFAYVAEKADVISNAGFDWMIKPETVTAMREGKFKAKK